MSTSICSCEKPSFGNMGRPNCVIEQKTMAFPILVPRFKPDGTRNTINVASPSLGADIQALISTSTAPELRLYPFPRVEEATWERTPTVYEEAPSNRKFKIDGVGGVYTLSFKVWGKDSAYQVMREALKFGCSELDFYYVDVAGNLWGIKDNVTDTVLRGYEMSTETFDSFVEFATDTTVQKGMFSWDIENTECIENSYCITSDELGYKATDLTPNQSAFQTAVAISATEIEVTVFTGFGSALNRDAVEGLVDPAFVVQNLTQSTTPAVTSTETTPGVYTLTIAAQTTGDVLEISTTAAGYDVETVEVTAL